MFNVPNFIQLLIQENEYLPLSVQLIIIIYIHLMLVQAIFLIFASYLDQPSIPSMAES